MSTQTQRLLEPPEGELVSPLIGRDYGPFAKAKRNWRKPLGILVAETLAHERALLVRLTPGLWAPPIVEDYERNSAAYHELLRHTQEQIKALQTFSLVDWRE